LKPVAGKKLLAGAQQAMKAPLWRKLAALNIEGWGKTTCMEMATQYSDVLALYDAVEKDSELPILQRRFAVQKAETFLQFFKVHQELVVALDNLGFFASAAEERIENPKIAGKTFCITGSLPGVSDRHLAEEEIRKRGGLAKGSVGRKLDYLVVGEAPGDTKLRAALRWNTKRLTPEEFFALMEWQPSCPKLDPEREF
jgi:DNA ligase (NAD+)